MMVVPSLEALSQVSDRNMVKAVTVHDSDKQTFIPLLLKCPNLEQLTLLEVEFQWKKSNLLEETLYKLTTLRSLIISGGRIPEFGRGITNLAELRQLFILGLEYGQFPNYILLLDKLEELDLNNSKLYNSDLSNLYLLKRLKYLNLWRTGIREFPDDIVELTELQELILPKSGYKKYLKEQPDFCAKLPYLFQEKPLETKSLTGVVNYSRKMGYSWAFRSLLLNLLGENTARIEQLATIGNLLAITNIPRQEMLRLKALDYYQEHFAPQDLSFLAAADSTLAVLGKLGINKNELRQKLKDIGIKYTTKITDKTTAVVIGQTPKDSYLIALERKIPILIESKLIEFLDGKLDLYLLEGEQEAVAPAQTQEQIEQVGNLLRSNNDDNRTLALTFFKHGGFPKELLTSVYIALRQTTHATIERECQRLIKQYGSIMLINYSKQTFPIFSETISESSCLSTLKRLAKNTELDTAQIAQWGQQYYGRGKTYLLSLYKGKDKIAYLKTLCDGTQLDLSANGIKKYPESINKLTFLTQLDLSQNYYLENIPDSIVQLTKLQKLNIRGCQVSYNPAKIAALQQLLPEAKIIHV